MQSSRCYPANDQPKLSLFILRDTSKFRTQSTTSTQSTTPTITRLLICPTPEEKSSRFVRKNPLPLKMPSLRRKKDGLSTSASPTRVSSRNSPSRSAVAKTPMKSPLRHVRHAGITKNQKSVLLDDLNLESTFKDIIMCWKPLTDSYPQ